MKTNMYTVYDKVAMESAVIFHAKHDAVAMRDFANVMRRRENPEDFQLLKLGVYDHDTMKIEMLNVPEEMHVAVQKKEVENE